MSIRKTSHLLRNAASVLTLVGTTAMLAGCATLGQGNDPMITGSTSNAAGARANQPMPAAIGTTQVAQSRFTPPADIGGGTGRATSPAPMMIDRSTAQPVGGVPQPTVSSQDLPDLQPSSVTSAPAMPAQPAVATAPSPAPQPMPQAAPVAAAPSTGGTYMHTIASGESLYTIARRYDVSAQSIVEANGLSSPDRIVVGQRLSIPGRSDLVTNGAAAAPTQVAAAPSPARPAAGAQTLTPPSGQPAAQPPQQAATPAPQPQPQQPAPEQPTQTATAPQPAATPAADSGASERFRWPVSGRVITDFAASRGTGINIEAPEGTTIRAAENGEVIYVGSAVEGYGNLILIKHNNGFVSAYAHLRDIGVVKGDTVNRGDPIGTAGMTGSVTRPQLHFELRRGATPVDPVPHLAG